MQPPTRCRAPRGDPPPAAQATPEVRGSALPGSPRREREAGHRSRCPPPQDASMDAEPLEVLVGRQMTTIAATAEEGDIPLIADTRWKRLFGADAREARIRSYVIANPRPEPLELGVGVG